MRDEVMAQLIDLVLADENFREHARQDLRGALAEAGFSLEPDELAAMQSFRDQTAGSTDAEVVEGLRRLL